jgi:CheY-like chemotaxis protein
MLVAGKSILIVEDNPLQREAMALILCQEGYRVTMAENGREALHQLRSGTKFELVLLDMMLPAQDGWKLLEEKNDDPTLAPIPVVIMTALSVASKEWAFSLGAAGFLRKPVGMETLLKEVRRLC